VNDSRSAGGDRHAVVSIRKQFSCSLRVDLEALQSRVKVVHVRHAYIQVLWDVRDGNEMNTVIMDTVLC